MSLLQKIASEKQLIIKQRKEMIELVGFETRNKYEIFGADGQQIGFAAEQQKGWLGILGRQFLGHWRSFDIHVFDMQRQLQFIARHPFRIYFERLEVEDAGARKIGEIEREFAILQRKFSLSDSSGHSFSRMQAGFFRIWTFPFLKDGREVAMIKKEWGGVLKEVFIDADTFSLEFLDAGLSADQRAVLLCSAVLIDLLYFENNQSRGGLLDVLSN